MLHHYLLLAGMINHRGHLRASCHDVRESSFSCRWLIPLGLDRTTAPRRRRANRSAVSGGGDLLAGPVPFDFGSMRYTGSAEQLNALRVATLNGTPLAWIDGVKGANAEAYYYWHRAIQLGGAELR
jgi:hypothetical protein